MLIACICINIAKNVVKHETDLEVKKKVGEYFDLPQQDSHDQFPAKENHSIRNSSKDTSDAQEKIPQKKVFVIEQIEETTEDVKDPNKLQIASEIKD